MFTAMVVAALLGRSAPLDTAPPRPKLVLLISIDQFRADYIRKDGEEFLPAHSGRGVGGFKYLMEDGADYLDAHHNHIPTATGPGHATLMTGSEPCLNGIANNDWFDRATGKSMYCVSDPTVKTVGGPSAPMSAKNLVVTTVGDELKEATNGKSKVVGISFKDRAAILMAGHAADDVYWLDGKSGAWVTSTYFKPEGVLPGWVSAINDMGVPAKAVGKHWEPLLPSAAYAHTRPAPFETPGSSVLFSHEIKSLSDFTRSSFGQEYLFQSAEKLVDESGVGTHADSDVMVVNLATNDYIGHMWGPNSPEGMDITVRTDRLLSHLFNKLDQKIGLKNVTIVVTADHGVVPITEELKEVYRIPVTRLTDENIGKSIQDALSQKYGEGKYLAGEGVYDEDIYLNHETLASKNVKLEEAEDVAAAAVNKVKGIQCTFTASQIMAGALPKWSWVQLVTNGYNQDRSGDLLVFTKPGSLQDEGNGTSHSEPWDYDSHVPLLLAGAGIHPGRYFRRVTTADIATTLSILLRVETPSGNLGVPLVEALGGSSR